MILSILIPSIESRSAQLERLRRSIANQLTQDVEICISVDRGQMSIGQKRNELTRGAKGTYCASIDDDDRISIDYISSILRGIATDPDCCSLVGAYYKRGKYQTTFRHSIDYNGWYEKDGILYRYPNHLNCIRTDIAKQMVYPETNDGEDKSFSQQLQASGLLKTEYKIETILYHYDYIPKVR